MLERRALDHLGHGGLRAGRVAVQEFLRLCRRNRARDDDDSAHHADDGGGACCSCRTVIAKRRSRWASPLENDRAHRHADRVKGIVTGVLLALARVAGETAPLLFTAFGNRFWNHSLSEPIAALAAADFHLRHLAVRRLASPGLGRRARSRRRHFPDQRASCDY